MNVIEKEIKLLKIDDGIDITIHHSNYYSLINVTCKSKNLYDCNITTNNYKSYNTCDLQSVLKLIRTNINQSFTKGDVEIHHIQLL